MDVKRIAFLCQPYHKGGVTRWMADAAIALSNLGHDIYFITVDPKKDFASGRGKETLIKLLSYSSNKIHIIKKQVDYEFEFGTPEYMVYTYRNLILNNLEPGIPIIVSDVTLIWDVATTLVDRNPMVGIFHCDSKYYYDLPDTYFNYLSFYFCVSQRISENLYKRYPQIDKSKIKNLTYGTQLPSLLPKLNVEKDIIKLVFLGRFDAPEKRAIDMIEICNALHINNIPFSIQVIGNEPNYELFMNYIVNYGLERFIKFRGWLPKKDIQDILFQSDIVLLPSEYEGKPISMMEALACGCGFVGTRVSGVEDYENDPIAQKCFRVFAIGDIHDAVKKIKALSVIPKIERQQAAATMAKTYFDINTCVQEFADALTITHDKMTPRIFVFSIKNFLYSKLLANARKIKFILLSKK